MWPLSLLLCFFRLAAVLSFTELILKFVVGKILTMLTRSCLLFATKNFVFLTTPSNVGFTISIASIL